MDVRAPRKLGTEIVEWLSIHGAPLGGNGEVVAISIDAPGRYPTLSDCLENRGIDPRTLHKRLTRTGLPPAGAWFRLGRALGAALRLQAWPHKAVHTHALELRLEDASPLRRSFRRLFDTSPSTVKQTIGWEWLAERWWIRHRSIRP